MPAKKKTTRTKRAKRPAGPKPAEISERLATLETTVERLVLVAERHGDEVFPKPTPPADETTT